MRCFNHPETRAVGTCKQCGKGICHDCAADLGHGLACRGVHEADVEAVHALVVRNIAATREGANRVNWFTVPLFLAVMGAAFVAYGLTGPRAPNVITLGLGAAFLLYAGVVFVMNLRMWRVARAQR